MRVPSTTSQTVGPFFSIGLEWLYRDNLVAEGVAGERITIQGRLFDGDRAPVPDALLEFWQANSYGKYNHREDTQDKPTEPAFTGFARVPVNAEGTFRLTTIKPGSVPSPNGKDQAPHLVVSIFMRGVLRRLVTRMYFPDDPQNATDPILDLVDPARRSTLIAKKLPDDPGTLEWNLFLQSPDETVFFDLGL
jgi:protocatechuate 3,4-dioxygenase alpha subunit